MNTLFLPMFAHVILCIVLYGLLTIARAPSIWGLGQRADGSNPFQSIQPKLSANLSNQFEWPMFFHLICVLLMSSGSQISSVYCLLAWVFVAGRVMHSGVQVFTANIRLRGIVFTINFIAVIAMWLMYCIEHIGS
ncbi:MAPEG family protein [Pseudoalteromonas sp.]|uniref:MAPEG family protein n=1 Tax=Pseudoalteromonas sp. TaxID=53249 RepID=UPI003002DC36